MVWSRLLLLNENRIFLVYNSEGKISAYSLLRCTAISFRTSIEPAMEHTAVSPSGTQSRPRFFRGYGNAIFKTPTQATLQPHTSSI